MKINKAWLFDIDGVITHPEIKQVTEEGIFTELISRLKKGEPVALVTGRSLEWIEERVLNALEERVESKEVLDNLFVSGEFGGSYIKFENGKREHFIDPNLSVPKDVIETTIQIANEFGETMMWDATKKTMVSIEMKDGVTVKAFRGPQSKLVEGLKELLNQKGLSEKYQAHKDRIATNIMEKRANKAHATSQVIDWLKARNIKPQQYIAFGDSKSDVGMAEEIEREGLLVEFVFVGEKEQLNGQNFPFPVTFTQGHCEKGTLEYLTSHT